MSHTRSSGSTLTTSVAGSADRCVAKPAMKLPEAFSTGEPSYFLVASTSGSASPNDLTMSKGSAAIEFLMLRPVIYLIITPFVAACAATPVVQAPSIVDVIELSAADARNRLAAGT